MQTDVKQVFYFHAGANSLTGFMEGPFRHIPTACSASLASSGGHITQEAFGPQFAEELNLKHVVSHGKVHAHVSGRHIKRNGPWVERSVSIIENFRLLDRVEADRLIAHIHIEHPGGGGPRRISFAGSAIEGLRVDGQEVTLMPNPTLLPQPDKVVDCYRHEEPIDPEVEWPALWPAAKHQVAAFLKKGAPGWAHKRFGWIADQKNPHEEGHEGYTICSLFDAIDGLPPGVSFGHCIELPDIGRIFLGENMIYPFAINLTMIRAELGCAQMGCISAGSIASNGSSCPPN